jgi:ribulose-5-phosphate 4-epimerase/fuculose-1-phosphate aldolase
MQGFSEGIFNHLTLVVPGRSDRYYQIPFGTHWSEVTASSFMEVGIDDGKSKRGAGEVERSCYCIHAPIHKARPQAKAVFHTHMPYASALTRLEDPRIKEIGQTEVDDGEACETTIHRPGADPAKRRSSRQSDRRQDGVVLANHGVTTVGNTVADAYDQLLLRRTRGTGSALRDVDTAQKAPRRRGRKSARHRQGRPREGPTPRSGHVPEARRPPRTTRRRCAFCRP